MRAARRLVRRFSGEGLEPATVEAFVRAGATDPRVVPFSTRR
ncbi:MAG: hypothetical protein ACC662_01170 [Planctomycetota bacterium]